METTTRGLFSSIQVGLLLGFSNIFLVTNSFVTEPIRNLIIYNDKISAFIQLEGK